MNIKLTIILSIITGIIGIVLCAMHNHWIIIRFEQPIMQSIPLVKTKKIRILYYWHNNRWHTESQELIWSPNMHDNVATLITSWLSLLDAEQIFPKKVMLQSVTLSPNKQEVYLSFDRNILPKEWSIQRKWMLIEGLLKTLRSNEISFNAIHFLIHHQPLVDAHLDFSFAWPIIGFLAPTLQY